MRGRQEMGIYALIILLRLVCVAAGSGPLMGTAGTAAFLASGAILFGGSKSLWGEGFLRCTRGQLRQWLYV